MTTLNIYPYLPHHQVVAGVQEEERRETGGKKKQTPPHPHPPKKNPKHKQVDTGLVGPKGSLRAILQPMSILPT